MKLNTKFYIIFGPQAENKFKSVFPGGVYVGKNTLRGESVFLFACGVQKCTVRSEVPSLAKPFRLCQRLKKLSFSGELFYILSFFPEVGQAQ